MGRSAVTVPRGPGAGMLLPASALISISLWMVQIAVDVAVVTRYPVSTLALVTLAGTLPALLCTPVAGVLADRYDVARLARAAMLAQAVCLGLMALTLSSGLVPLTVAYAAQGVLNSLWPPARQLWLYGVVPPESRHAANASVGSVNGLMTLVGAAFGGVLSAWDPAAAVAVAAGTQLTACLLLFRTRRPTRRPDPDEAGPRPSTAARLREGVVAARDHPLARSVVWIGIAWGFIGGGYTVLLAGHVTRDLGGSPAVLGAVYAVDGAAVLVSTLLAGRVRRQHHLGLYGAAYVVQGLGWALLFASPSLVPLLIFLIVMRLAGGCVIALDMSILLDTVPDRVRGRITSLHLTTFTAVGRIALGVLGGVLAVVAIPVVGVATGLASALFGVVWWLVSGRSARAVYLAAGRGAP